MKIFVKAKTGAREEAISKIDESHFLVRVKEQPEKGRANLAIVKVLAEHFDAPLSRIRLVSGQTSKQKVFIIEITPR